MKAKRLTILFLINFLCTHYLEAQNPGWLWAKSSGGAGKEQSFGVARDAAGNSYITGYFMSPTISFASTNLNTTGGRDIFVTKYDASGNALWAKSFGGSGDEEGFGIASDAAGNVVVAGYFASAALAIGNNTLACGGQSDIFVAKFDAAGNVLWARSAGGATYDDGNAVALDASGNVYVTGYFTSSTITFGNITLTSAGGFDVFVVKYDPSGNVLWAKSMAGSAVELGFSVATDAGGNAFVAGNFMGSSLVIGASTYTFAAGQDMFLAKLDAAGNVIWVRAGGGNGTQFARTVSATSGGNVVLSGDFDGSILTFGTNTLSSSGGKDIFTVNYDANGTIQWVRAIGGSGNEFGLGSSGEPGGDSYVTGYFMSPTLSLGTNTLSNAGAEDILLVKYDALGNVLWAKSVGGSGSEIGSAVCSDLTGNVWVTGAYCSPSLPFSTTTLSCAGILDIYAAKLTGAGSSVGLEEKLELAAALTVYPNPFAQEAHILCSRPLRRATFFIQNSLGQTMKEIGDLSGESIVISRGNLPQGIYFYSIVEDQRPIACGKFVIRDE